MRLPILLIAAVLAAAAAVPAPATAAGCRQVEFTPNSDDLAGAIRVDGVSCRYARRFIRRTEGTPPATHRGWSCTSRQVEPAGLPYLAVRCIRGEDRMRWKRF